MQDQACAPDAFLSTAPSDIETTLAPTVLLFGQTVAHWRVGAIVACSPTHTTYVAMHELTGRRALLDTYHAPALTFDSYDDGVYRVAAGTSRLLDAGVLADGRPYVVHDPYEGTALEIAIETAIVNAARRAGFVLQAWPASTVPVHRVAESPAPELAELPEPPDITFESEEPTPVDPVIDVGDPMPVPWSLPAVAERFDPDTLRPRRTVRRWRTVAWVSGGLAAAACAAIYASSIVELDSSPGPQPALPAYAARVTAQAPVERASFTPRSPAAAPKHAPPPSVAAAPSPVPKPTPPAPHRPPPIVRPQKPAVSVDTVATAYQRVGHELAVLEGKRGPAATAALWPRFHAIHLDEALATAEARTSAAAKLAEIHAAVAAAP
jgi:hypothetical protein